MASPLLPWEVIERVIGHSGDDRRSLHNFSLTCRFLRPRALCLLAAEVRFRHRDQIFNFCDFLKANPHLKPFVRSIYVPPHELAPFPLLSLTPNLSTFWLARFISKPTIYALNQSTLTSCKLFGTRIQTLILTNLSFATYPEFARVLLAFTSLTDLGCYNVTIKEEGHRAPLDVLKRHPQRLRLRAVHIHYNSGGEDVYDKSSVAALLLDSGLVQSTVKTLAVRTYRSSYNLLHVFTWPRLWSLVFQLDLKVILQTIPDPILFVKNFSPSTLKNVTIELYSVSIPNILNANEEFSGGAVSRLFKELERALLRFRQPRIMWLLNDSMFGCAFSFWTQEIGKRFPALLHSGRFVLKSRKAVMPGAGHGGDVYDLATSPGGEWVATASIDSTIILWDTTDGTIARQWVAHNYRPVSSLAFSPDGRYLASTGEDQLAVKIWGLVEGTHEVVLLQGHTSQATCCAWSPRGDIIAAGSKDATIRLWDACTFHELYVLEQPEGAGINPVHQNQQWLIAFSPDGCWLVSGFQGSYDRRLWNITSGTLHKSFIVHPDDVRRCVSAAFDPRSTRLLIAEYSETKLVDVETSEKLAVLRASEGIKDVAFSPDGTLVLTASNRGMVKLWDAYTGVELLSLKGHRKTVNQVCFSPCGKYVASASADGTVRLWRVRDGLQCVTMAHSGSGTQVLFVAFSLDGKTLWSGDWHGQVHMWRL